MPSSVEVDSSENTQPFNIAGIELKRLGSLLQELLDEPGIDREVFEERIDLARRACEEWRRRKEGKRGYDEERLKTEIGWMANDIIFSPNEKLREEIRQWLDGR